MAGGTIPSRADADVVTASAANLMVVPAVSLAFFLLWMDRQFGTHFFDPAGGGQPLLWQHLFWIFGHPWVYAIVLPAMGMVSDGLPVFCTPLPGPGTELATGGPTGLRYFTGTNSHAGN